MGSNGICGGSPCCRHSRPSELARVLVGVEVCLSHRVYDAKSGANFPAGRQHLDARQALAFVRQRDGLTNGDLDRTHRQQAFLDSVLHQLRTEGVLTDLTRMTALLSVAGGMSSPMRAGTCSASPPRPGI
jgi:anionic cell wall polymer biosynthesis LytR-Cps2A-Psr (LCP) family protein